MSKHNELRNKKGIYPVEDSSHYGEVLYGYSDLEEAKKDYKEQTGEDLNAEIAQFVNVEETENGFSWVDQDKGIPSIICIE